MKRFLWIVPLVYASTVTLRLEDIERQCDGKRDQELWDCVVQIIEAHREELTACCEVRGCANCW